MVKERIYKGNCRMCMQGDCLTLNKVVDGVLVKIEGNPESPTNRGNLCPRGASAIMTMYNPYRVKTPLKRTNPRKGLDEDPGWVEISWEEALETVAAKLREIRAEDPRQLVINEGWGERETLLRVPFARAFGTPNDVGTHGALCSVHFGTCLVQANFPVSVPDMTYCRYHITVGRSTGPNFATTPGIRKFTEAMARGMRLVVVDPRCSIEASKGEWVPIRPGTDLAFVLAFAHVMLHEIKIWDEWFLKNRTNAPYLIGPDGEYLRDPQTGKPLMWHAGDRTAKPFDDPTLTEGTIALEGAFTVNGVPCKTAFTLIREEFARYTPEWAEEITTVPAATIRRLAREFVEAAQIGSTITIDGFQFPFRPVAFICERGTCSHRGGNYADLTTKIINLLVGAMEVPGGCLGAGKRGPVLKPDADGTVTPAHEAVPTPFKFPPDHVDMSEFYPVKHTGPHLAAKAILEPEKYYLPYRVKAWLGLGGNSIRALGSPHLMVEALKRVPFVCTISYCFDEVTDMADIVLPEHCFLERVNVQVFWPQHQATSEEVNGLDMIYAREPLPPLFNTRHCDDILIELAERIGILYGPGGLNDQINQAEDFILGKDGLCLREPFKLDLYRKYTVEEIYDLLVKSYLGPEHSLRELQEKGMIYRFKPRKTHYNYYYFPDNKTRHPFYFYHLKKVGDELRAACARHGVTIPGWRNQEEFFAFYRAIPCWIPNSQFDVPPEYDLWLVNWKTPYYSSGTGFTHGNPWMQEVAAMFDPYDFYVCLNRRTAESKGLKDGDRVWVESPYGRVQGIVKTSELFHPEVVGIAGNRGLKSRSMDPVAAWGSHYNSLLPMDDETFDPVNGGVEISPRVRVYKVQE